MSANDYATACRITKTWLELKFQDLTTKMARIDNQMANLEKRWWTLQAKRDDLLHQLQKLEKLEATDGRINRL